MLIINSNKHKDVGMGKYEHVSAGTGGKDVGMGKYEHVSAGTGGKDVGMGL